MRKGIILSAFVVECADEGCDVTETVVGEETPKGTETMDVLMSRGWTRRKAPTGIRVWICPDCSVDEEEET